MNNGIQKSNMKSSRSFFETDPQTGYCAVVNRRGQKVYSVQNDEYELFDNIRSLARRSVSCRTSKNMALMRKLSWDPKLA